MTRYLVAIILLAASPALAAERSIDFTQRLTSAMGEPMQQKDKDGNVEPLTLGDVALIALETPTDDDRTVDARKKFERDLLARRIWKNAHAELSPEDIALIKERIGKVYGPAQIGATWPLLDPTLQPKQ